MTPVLSGSQAGVCDKTVSRTWCGDDGRSAQRRSGTELGTRDAIHLATALLWKTMTAGELTMATHDEALGVAATAHGLPVIGRA